VAEPYLQFRKDAAEKLSDQQLSENLKTGRTLHRKSVDAASLQFTSLETARKRAAFIRWKALENLDKYLIEFEANFIRSGGKIIWAQDDADACSEIIGIINRSGEKNIVKSKSLTSDEIGLDETLKQYHKSYTETGLSRYILQLANEKPSHMVMPSLHKSMEQVSSLISQKNGKSKQEDATNLVHAATFKLRAKQTKAGIGISGVNFLLADAGAIAISENEGNELLTTSKPRIQILIAGIDKILPSINDLNLFLPLLSCYANGQKLNAYNTIIKGPRKNDEPDGPEELYVVLVDNGRSSLLSPGHRSIASCINCGSCLYNDPVYGIVGGHVYQSTWMGPVGAVALPHLKGIKDHGFWSEVSTLSAADTECCPVNINFNKLLLSNRQQVASKQQGNASDKIFYFLWKKAMLKREIIKWQGSKTRTFFLNSIFFKSPSNLRKMKQPAKESFNQLWRKRMNP